MDGEFLGEHLAGDAELFFGFRVVFEAEVFHPEPKLRGRFHLLGDAGKHENFLLGGGEFFVLFFLLIDAAKALEDQGSKLGVRVRGGGEDSMEVDESFVFTVKPTENFTTLEAELSELFALWVVFLKSIDGSECLLILLESKVAFSFAVTDAELVGGVDEREVECLVVAKGTAVILFFVVVLGEEEPGGVKAAITGAFFLMAGEEVFGLFGEVFLLVGVVLDEESVSGLEASIAFWG